MQTRKQEPETHRLLLTTKPVCAVPFEDAAAHRQAAEQLQTEAWTAFNAAFHAPDGEEYRRAGRELYRRMMEEQMLALFTRGDEQNRILDARGHA
jgi:hypothetical protein